MKKTCEYMARLLKQFFTDMTGSPHAVFQFLVCISANGIGKRLGISSQENGRQNVTTVIKENMNPVFNILGSLFTDQILSLTSHSFSLLTSTKKSDNLINVLFNR